MEQFPAMAQPLIPLDDRLLPTASGRPGRGRLDGLAAASRTGDAGGPLVDGFGRLHNNLRISVTDRCNIRCFYCMPEEGMAFRPRQELLTFEEIERFVRVAVSLGVDKVRLTGGEPLVRRDLPELVRRLSAVPGLRDLALTTNGLLLPAQAEALRAAGLSRLNIHLDTLDPQRFRRITRRDGVETVIGAVRLAKRLGFGPVKLNAVAVKGLTEPDIVPLAEFARELDIQVRFIEYMPLDADRAWARDRVLLAEEILETVRRGVGELLPAPGQDPRAPATDFVFADGRGGVGVIPTISRPFCMSCNRVRLTADGKLRYCLFATEETDVRSLLRGGSSDADIAAAVRGNVAAKWEGHEINTARFLQPERTMSAIGG
jgi:cyclic pyranopterin phosphate synthase